MKKVFNFSFAVILILVFLGCGPSRITPKYGFQNNPPFKVIEATYNKSIDIKPGVQGITINVSINNAEVKLDSIYFRNNSTIMERDKDVSKTKFIGNFVISKTYSDLQLNIDSKLEYGNSVPDISQKIPFQLKANEAVVSYFSKNEMHYFKISNLNEISK